MKNVTHSGRIPSLDGLRAVSIVMVLLSHSSATVMNPRASNLLGWIGTGSFGVSIFFVISGFLITTLLADEQRTMRSINLGNFYIRRAFRIFPAFYVYWLFVLTLTLIGYLHVSQIDLLTSAVYIWNYVHRNVDTWFLGHTWSLSVEEQFYLLWPFILRVAKTDRAKWTALSVIFVSPLLRVTSYFCFPSSRPLIGMMLPTRADSLMIGSLLALLVQNETNRAVVKRVTQSTLIPAVMLGFLAIDAIFSRRFKGAYILPIGYSLENLVIAGFVAHVVYGEQTWVGKFLNHRAVVHLGTISYSLYLWQQMFLTPKNTTFTGTFPLNVLCAIVAAELSYYLIEKPFLNLRRRLSNSSAHTDLPAKADSRRLAASVSA